MSKFETEMDFVRAGDLSHLPLAIDEFNNLSPAEQQGIFDRLQVSDENIRHFYKLCLSLRNYNASTSWGVISTFIEFLGELVFPGYQFSTFKNTNSGISVIYCKNLPSYYTYDFVNSKLPKMMEVKSILRAIFNKPNKKTINRMKLFFVANLADNKKHFGKWIMENKENGSVTFM